MDRRAKPFKALGYDNLIITPVKWNTEGSKHRSPANLNHELQNNYICGWIKY
jgi:hypothetical protein